LANDPEEKTLGIVGMGGIGQTIAKRMLGWDMKILYHNRKPISPQPDFPCEYVQDLDELVKRSDVIALSLPVSL
jgi:glyoxylate reductase